MISSSGRMICAAAALGSRSSAATHHLGRTIPAIYLELLLYILERVVGLAVAAALLTIGKLHLLARRLLVWDLVEEVGNDVEAGAALVVGARHVPGREIGVGGGEHLVAGARVVVPAAVGLEVHRRELPDLARVVDAPLE